MEQPQCPSADEWIRKLCYIHRMEYYSAVKRNTSESILMRRMNPEPILQSEVSQKEKDKYCTLTHIWNLERWCWRSYVWSSREDTDIKNRFGSHSGRMRGWDDWREQHWNIYITIWKRQPVGVWCMTQGPKASVLWKPGGVGWGGRWGTSRGWGHIYTCGWFMLMYMAKTITIL